MRQTRPWQTVWKWHRRMAGDGTWDRVHAVLLARADATGAVDWSVSVDSTIARAHHHATNITRITGAPSNYNNPLVEPSDQIGRRIRRGSRGGRLISYDRDDYRGRNVIARRFATLKQWRCLATRYDKLAIVYRSAAVFDAAMP